MARTSDTSGTVRLAPYAGKVSVGAGSQTTGGMLSVQSAGANALLVGRSVSASSTNTVVTIDYTSAVDQALAFRNTATNGRVWSIGDGIGVSAGFCGIYDQNAAANRLTIDTAGKVGIGTTIPQESLHVTGNIRVDGNINAKYQDIAEWVSISKTAAAGTVVALDPDQTNMVMPSLTAYDTKVAGVVSANPGLILGDADDGKAKIATTGRVKVRVDATAAPVRVGDLLVTSAKEGMAMRSMPVEVGGIPIHRPGTLIGKALESLETGEGEVLVLLSLQ